MDVRINTDYNKWLKDIPENDVEATVNKFLKLGYITSTLCQTTINPLNTIFKPIQDTLEKNISNLNSNNIHTMKLIETKIDENLSDVKKSIDSFRDIKSKSIIKGKVGESLIENIINNNFPDDCLKDTSGISHSADYQLYTSDNKIIFIEIKTYSSVVNNSEINKFIKDLKRSGGKIGIFISATSGIIGKKRLEVETVDDIKIIYIPNSGFEEIPIIWAILLAKELLKVNVKNSGINENSLNELYNNFEKIYRQFCQVKYEIKSSKDGIEKILDNLYHKSLELDVNIYKALKDAQNMIKDELHDINITLNDAESDDINNFLDKLLKTNDNRFDSYKQLYDISKERNYIIRYPDDMFQWYIFNNDDLVCEMKVKKKKIELLLNNRTVTIDCNKSGLEFFKKVCD